MSHGRPKILILLLRVSLGWMFFYSGLIKILDKTWSSKGFLVSAKTFPGFYSWFTSPQNLPWVDFLNKWGQLLIGAALILGVFVGIAALAGAVLMALYYFPGLQFPYVENGVLIDLHVIYLLALLMLSRLRAGRIWGLNSFFGRSLY
ncbi:MAG: DoxX family protein [Patescibacteria group bacterium]|nr:DoxX family protein [Patescibacteria group bacterium]